jgi:hypothetical protein
MGRGRGAGGSASGSIEVTKLGPIITPMIGPFHMEVIMAKRRSSSLPILARKRAGKGSKGVHKERSDDPKWGTGAGPKRHSHVSGSGLGGIHSAWAPGLHPKGGKY